MKVRPTLDELRALAPAERLAAIAAIAQLAEAARPLRDEAIREMRATGRYTIDQIAEAAEVSPATVKIVVRGQ